MLTSDGEVEMDAMLMDGRTLDCGGVAAVNNVRNPIELARVVLEEIYPGIRAPIIDSFHAWKPLL